MSSVILSAASSNEIAESKDPLHLLGAMFLQSILPPLRPLDSLA
jgi:hypothetical protein